MDIFGIGICAVCAVIFGALVKRGNKEYALLISIIACVIILLAVLGDLGPVISQIEGLAEAGSFPGFVLTAVLKAVGIAIAGQLAANVCKDAGESALAYTVDLAAKAAILAVSLPLFLKVFEYLEEIVKL